ncbi:hypothetical protein [Methylobacterium sp. ID0610]|uniref:hypothetical protein n=1 Tax=Methylobacterium carpenticola TaxID=3344827 RepID=UPI00369F0434
MTKRERFPGMQDRQFGAAAQDDQPLLKTHPADRQRRIEEVLGVRIGSHSAEAPTGGAASPMSLELQSVELVRAFGRIRDAEMRQQLLDLVAATAERLDGRD